MQIPKGARFDVTTGQWLYRQTQSVSDDPIKLGQRLANDQRGVVLPSPTIVNSRGRGFGLETPEGVVPAVPTAALLLFDVIDSPALERFHINEIDDEYLKARGVLVRSLVQPTIVDAEALKTFATDVFLERLQIEPGGWSIWQWPHQGSIPTERLTPDAGFKLSLESALVIPDVSVPYDDVLEFKDRYRKELRTLRHHIEKLCVKVGRSGYNPPEIRIEQEEFVASLAEYLEVARRPNWKKAVASLDVSFNLSGLMMEAFKQGIPGVIGGLAGAVGGDAKTALVTAGVMVLGQLSLSSTFGLNNAGDNPFAYCARVEKEFR